MPLTVRTWPATVMAAGASSPSQWAAVRTRSGATSDPPQPRSANQGTWASSSGEPPMTAPAGGGRRVPAEAGVGEPGAWGWGERGAADDGAGGGRRDETEGDREEGEASHGPDHEALGHPEPGGPPATALGARAQPPTPSTAR